MKYEYAVEIEELSAAVEVKRLAYDAQRIRNRPSDPTHQEEAKKAYIEMQIAEVEYNAALAKLAAAKTRIVGLMARE